MAPRLIKPAIGLRGFRKPTRPALDVSHPLSRGLVGYYLLGDNPGLAADLSIAGNGGAYVGSPAAVASHHGGLATNFNGTTQFVSIPNKPANQLNTFTVGAFVRVTGGSGTYRTIIFKGDAASNQSRNYDLEVRAPGNVFGTYFTQGVANFKGFDGSISASGSWQHVVTTYDGTTLSLFVDGVSAGAVGVGGAPDVTSDPLLIGASQSTPTVLFPGDIEGVRIYNRALSLSEIFAWKAQPYAGVIDAGAPNYFLGTTGGAVTHPSTGALVGQGSTVAGTATRFRAHPSSGAIVGPGAVVAGTAAHTGLAHATSGALVGQGALVVGAATRFTVHPTSGALTGAGALVVGTANRTKFHPSSGVLTGQGSTVAGSAVHTVFVPSTHTTTGVLIAQGAIITGVAQGKIWTPVPPTSTTWTPATTTSVIWTPQ